MTDDLEPIDDEKEVDDDGSEEPDEPTTEAPDEQPKTDEPEE